MGHIAYDTRKPVTEPYDIEEFCPWCNDTIPVWLDPNCMDDLRITCPVCNHSLMLCMACPNILKCDWKENEGCYVSRKEYVTAQKKMIYDELCAVLTRYEESDDDESDILYEMLVKIQNRWEDTITAEED